jgi:hypothetical protein
MVREAQNQVTARVLIWTAAVVAPGAAWGGHLGVQTGRFLTKGDPQMPEWTPGELQ